MTWLSRFPSSSKWASIVTSVELAGRGAQEEVSLAQLRGDEGREKDAQLKCAVTACEDMMVVSILL